MFGHQQSTLLDRPLASMKRTNPVFGREDANDRVRWWTAAGTGGGQAGLLQVLWSQAGQAIVVLRLRARNSRLMAIMLAAPSTPCYWLRAHHPGAAASLACVDSMTRNGIIEPSPGS